FLAGGVCGLSPFSHMCYALILSDRGDADGGWAHGKAALALMEKLDAKQLSTVLPLFFGSGIHHWKAPGRDSVAYFETAAANGLETGDYEYASLAVNFSMFFSFYFGKSIDSLLHQFPRRYKILRSFGKKYSIDLAKYWHQLLVVMHDPAGDGITVSGDIMDENRLIPLLEKRQNLTFLGFCMLCKLKLAYLAGDYETARSVRGGAIDLLKALTGNVFIPVCHFFAALTCIACHRTLGKDPSLLRDAKRSLKKLKKWGADAPENYLYKAQLVEAELLAVKGKQAPALKLYEAAIENAAKAGNNLDLGIACERMGRYLESVGLEAASIGCIQRSIAVFHRWGALNKSHRLSREYGVAISADDVSPGSIESSSASRDINVRLDLEALAGTIETLTGDLRFDSLLETLLTAVMQSSGATRVVYMHAERGILRVKAEKRANDNVGIFDGKDAAPASFGLPVSLLEKCYSGDRERVMENLADRGETKGGPPKGGRPGGGDRRNPRLKSILIIPLKRRRSVTGLVYLENDLMEDAFREDQARF
ncbi:MAG: hypothetical protein GY859_00010, partial [Desulfobacterales bacterium]|nr:hypothetical protein [Desulfobacterales bacterium]